MTREDTLKLDYGDDSTNELMSNYADSRTCDNCSHGNDNNCAVFDINIPEVFTCISFKGKANDI